MARSIDCNMILKYCEIVDEFIKVRVFNEEDLCELLQVKSIPNKTAYQQLIVNACVVNYHEEVLPLFKKMNRVYKTAALEELLYQICVEVNPHLEIHQVALPMDRNQEDGEKLHLLQAPGLGNQRASSKNLSRIESDLLHAVIGQPTAIHTVMRSVRKAAAGLRDPHRPIGVFLLIGQTGTGKTELAKQVTRSLFRDMSKLVRIDCSEYALPHEYSKLIGAPPGYVGHNEGGQLTESVRDRRSGVVLFDEIEKAHRKVHNLLLQIMDEGFLTDNKGSPVPFNKTIILLTSNIGVEEINTIRNRMGFDIRQQDCVHPEHAREATLEAMRNAFRPEFINRLDGVVVFNNLSEKDCIQISRLQLDRVAGYLAKSGIELTYTPQVVRSIARLGYNPDYGARELRRIIQNQIEDPLSERILNAGYREGDCVRISVRRQDFVFSRRRRRTSTRPGSEGKGGTARNLTDRSREEQGPLS